MRRALSFLTPLGGATTPDNAALSWFSVVGAAIGLAVGTIWWAASKGWAPWPAAALALCADLALTGLLHVDGLADSADGLLAPMTRQQRLEAMADPAVGAFGVTAVVAVLLLRVSALATAVPSPLAVGGLWCVSRAVVALIAQHLPYARPGGLVEGFRSPSRHPRATLVGGVALGVAMAAAARGGRGGVAAAVEVLTMAAVTVTALRRLGGFTGDVLGAAVVIGETAGLLVLAWHP